eukprot:4577534-Amphidinium_carterae.1
MVVIQACALEEAFYEMTLAILCNDGIAIDCHYSTSNGYELVRVLLLAKMVLAHNGRSGCDSFCQKSQISRKLRCAFDNVGCETTS